MATKIQMFQAADGSLHKTEKDADLHDLNLQFIDRLIPIQGKAFQSADLPADRRAFYQKGVSQWLIANQGSIYELLDWFIASKEDLDVKHKKG